MTESTKTFLAGWAGGIGILAVGHPFDTVKTLMQNAPPGMYRGSLDCVTRIVKEGGPLALYRGVMAPMAGIGTIFAIYFLTYDACERLLRRLSGKPSTESLALYEVMLCGGSTGVCGSLILGPAELLKITQQVALQNKGDSSFGAAVKTVRGTPGGFSRGLGATMFRDVPGSMAWFGAYETAKAAVCEDPKKPSVSQALFAGGCGGLGMWSFALPLDTVKTRVQAAKGGEKIGFTGAARQIMSEAGVAGFYRGFAPVLLRAFPANAACFAAKEMTKSTLDQMF